ncbi:MAG: SRPBCC family protein [Acidobacteriaceae bacterium]|nr:SRPBCC family protein [Acidobacteriaceae bacterium]
MKVYTLAREQLIHRPLHQTFSFFADARNLEAITPPWLRFEIVSAPAQLATGSEIVYRLKWHSITLQWKTGIEVWNPPATFVDVQKSGPYALWRHTHQFIPRGDDTLVIDHVNYALPFGPIGRLAHVLTVREDVDAIFDYRTNRVNELLDCVSAHSG